MCIYIYKYIQTLRDGHGQLDDPSVIVTVRYCGYCGRFIAVAFDADVAALMVVVVTACTVVVVRIFFRAGGRGERRKGSFASVCAMGKEIRGYGWKRRKFGRAKKKWGGKKKVTKNEIGSRKTWEKREPQLSCAVSWPLSGSDYIGHAAADPGEKYGDADR